MFRRCHTTGRSARAGRTKGRTRTGQFLAWLARGGRWVDLPAERHVRSGVLSSADGHLERWKRQARKSSRPKVDNRTVAQPEDLADLRCLQTVCLMVSDLTGMP